MPEHVYKVVELGGFSEESVTKAIDRADQEGCSLDQTSRLVRGRAGSRAYRRRQGGTVSGDHKSRVQA